MARSRWWSGDVSFGEDEEFLQFKYTFLMVLMLVGMPFSALFVALDWLGINSIGGLHRVSVQAYVIGSAVLIALLRGHKERYVAVAWGYALASYLVHTSGFLNVPEDELRLVWFCSLVAGTYILLGRAAGWAMFVLTVATVVGGNAYQPNAFTSRGMGTFVASLLSLSVFFHAYTTRLVSFDRRMTDSRRQLRHLARHDSLTGVLNVRATTELCESLIQLSARRHTAYAVLFIDLDHFKQINDTYGHDAGDLVLKSVANCLKQRLRKSDVLGRMGGEEFMAFLPDTDSRGATQLAQQLRADIEGLFPEFNGQRLKVTASIGVSTHQGDPGSLAALLREADQAMYQAKAAGRNRVTVFAQAA